MIKFQHKLAYKCNSKEEATELVSKLKKVGYAENNAIYVNYTEQHTYLTTNWNSISNGYGFNSSAQSFNKEEYLCDTKELFLALAAQRDSDEFHVGEYVKVIAEATCDYGDYRAYKSTDIFKIEQFCEEGEYLRHTKNELTGVHKELCRKANQEEITKFISKSQAQQIEDKPMNKETFAVKGNEFLLTALANELESLGLKKNNDKIWGEWNHTKTHLIIYQDNKPFGFYNHDGSCKTQLTLPMDYEKAIELAKNILKEDKVELIEGQWYWVDSKNFLINFQKLDNNANYGFDINGKWSDSMGFHESDKYVLASESDVKSRLLKEATKRGFKVGVEVNQLVFGKEYKYQWTIDYSPEVYNNELNTFSVGSVLVLKQGVWAEIITIPTIEINGYKAEFNTGNVTFGCKVIPVERIKALYELMEDWNDSVNVPLDGIQIRLDSTVIPMKTLKEIYDYYKNK